MLQLHGGQTIEVTSQKCRTSTKYKGKFDIHDQLMFIAIRQAFSASKVHVIDCICTCFVAPAFTLLTTYQFLIIVLIHVRIPTTAFCTEVRRVKFVLIGCTPTVLIVFAFHLCLFAFCLFFPLASLLRVKTCHRRLLPLYMSWRIALFDMLQKSEQLPSVFFYRVSFLFV